MMTRSRTFEAAKKTIIWIQMMKYPMPTKVIMNGNETTVDDLLQILKFDDLEVELRGIELTNLCLYNHCDFGRCIKLKQSQKIKDIHPAPYEKPLILGLIR